MYKYKITLIEPMFYTITATSSYPCFMGMGSEIENKMNFITIGDTIVRKNNILSIKEVKDEVKDDE